MKDLYTKPELELKKFEAMDVLTASQEETTKAGGIEEDNEEAGW